MDAALSSAQWVVAKALAPVADAWATSKNFRPHIEAIRMELLHLQATLETATRRQIGGPSMEELLRAEDLLDELDYFLIHEQLHGRYEVADEHTKHDVLNSRHTFTKAIGKLACLPACCSAANPAGEPVQIEDARKHVNGCMPKLGKLFPCSFSPHGHDDNSGQSTLCAAPQREHAMLGLNTVDVSERMKHIVEQLQPVRREITTILQSCDRITFPDISQSRLTSTAQIIESESYGVNDLVKRYIRDIINDHYCQYRGKPLTVCPVVGLGGIGKTTMIQHIYCNQQVLMCASLDFNLNKLLEEPLTVRPVVGLGGIGKTTMIQHIYCNQQVLMCASLDFNLNKLLEEIKESIPKIEGEKVGTTAELIDQRLKYKRFLIVVDDVWQIINGDNWEMLERSIRRKLSVDQQKTIRKEGIDMDIFWCIIDALAEECNHGKFSDVRRHDDQFFALIGDTVSAASGQSISSNYCGRAGGVVNLSQTAPQTGGLAAMKSLGTECVNFSVTDSSLQNRAHRISSADASGRLRPEVDTGFCSPLWVLDSGGAPLPWIYDTGASFSLTEDLCIPLPPRHHRPRGHRRQHHTRLPHHPRALSIQRLPRRRHASPVWIYDTGASLSLTENLSLLHHWIFPGHQHCPRAPQVHAHWIYDTGANLNPSLLHRRQFGGQVPHHWIYDTGASFSLTENLSLLHRRRLRVPEPQLHHQLPPPPVWIYDTGASFSLTGDLSLLPGVCSTGDCSPFLGLRRADPVSAANGQSVVSSKCGRASGTLNLSRTAPQTTGLISSEPIAADNSSLLTPDTVPEQTWRVASAAPQHMTGYLNHLIDYTPASGDQVIDTPNMGRMAVHGRGSVNTANITLQDVLYVPCLDANLVSTGQLAQLGYMITLGPYGCRIYKDDEDMPLVGEAHYVDGYLLELDFLRVRPSTN